MTSLLICIYLYLGFDWAQTLIGRPDITCPMFLFNIIFWPISVLISIIFGLKVKRNNSNSNSNIKGEL